MAMTHTHIQSMAEGVLAQGMSIFDPASPDAASIVDLAVLTLCVAGAIFLIVEGILVYVAWRFRERDDQAEGEPPQVYGSMPIEVAWTAAPTMIVFFLVLVTARTLWEVEPNPPAAQVDDETLFVTVIGHQWWWEYIYETWDGQPLGFTTANELHLPASDDQTSRPTFLKLKSADVCHSFWVPRLGGKVDLIPGRTNSLKLETTETGLHLGQCAEFCGAQHANMLIRVVVHPPEEFADWIASESLPARDDPAVQTGRQAFLAESCINCHRIRGTIARGDYAPDLTHLMSRETLAAGMIPNNAQNLRHWVHDPQSIKAGCLMPAFGLNEQETDAITNYLLSLQ